MGEGGSVFAGAGVVVGDGSKVADIVAEGIKSVSEGMMGGDDPEICGEQPAKNSNKRKAKQAERNLKFMN